MDLRRDLLFFVALEFFYHLADVGYIPFAFDPSGIDFIFSALTPGRRR